jgi:hypothetical protein
MKRQAAGIVLVDFSAKHPPEALGLGKRPSVGENEVYIAVLKCQVHFASVALPQTSIRTVEVVHSRIPARLRKTNENSK